MKSRILNLPQHRKIKDDASVWLVRIERGLTVDEHEEFKKWIHDDENHMNVFFALAQLWDAMDSLHQLGDLFPITKDSKSKHFAHEPSWFRLSPSFLQPAFAVLLVSAIIAIAFQFAPLTEKVETPAIALIDQTSFETEIGEYSRVNLPDFSEVSLSTNTKLDSLISEHDRRLTLHRGEAFFDVAHDSERPFIVIVGNKEVRALGTAFSVRRLDMDNIEVIVSEGKVLVSDLSTEEQDETSDVLVTKADSSREVARGQKLVTQQQVSESVLSELGDKRTSEELMWRKGKLVFKGDLLPDVISEVERYTNVKIEIVDQELNSLKVAGLFNAGDLLTLMTSFEENFNITYEWSNDKHIVLRQKQY